MRVPEHVILAALRRGGCIRTFYRLSARRAAQSASRGAEGFILEQSGEADVILSLTDFQALASRLVRTDTWEQTVGDTCFGGATWRLRPENDGE